MNKLVSVVMTTHNVASFVEEAINSVLSQTYSNFEFLIIDDGSSDDTCSVIEKRFKDKRICLYKQPHDYINALNNGMLFANGDYIARMDADDRMHPYRLELQLKMMECEPSVDICTCLAKMFGTKELDRKQLQSKVPNLLTHEIFLIELLRSNFICHPTAFIRKSSWNKYKLKYKDYPCAEDYKLWFDAVVAGVKIAVMPYPLYYYRVSEQQVSRRYSQIQQRTRNRVRKEITDYLASNTHDEAIKSFCQYAWNLFERGFIEEKDLFTILYKLFINQ